MKEDLEKPLVVLKFQKRRILWRLFIPYSLFLPMSLAMAIQLETLPGKLIFGVLFVIALCGLVFLLVSKEVRFYNDRIVQRFRLNISDWIVFLNNAQYQTMPTKFMGRFVFISNIDRRSEAIRFELGLLSRIDQKKFYEVLCELSGRTKEDLHYQYKKIKIMKAEKTCSSASES